PDVMAMGSSVYVASPYADAQYSSASGTSFSCPLAAGVAALILAENPKLTPMQVRDAMRNTANNSSSPNREYGWGILNALNAVNYNNIVFTHLPLSDTSNTIGPYKVTAKITSRLGIDENSVKLFWGRNTITDSLLMTKVSADSFVAFIPGNGTSATYKYYIFAKTLTGNVIKTHPKFAPNAVFSFNVSGNSVSFNTQSGWNLISVPLTVSNYSKDILFPNSTSNAFAYENGYVVKSVLENGKGYWLKFNQNQSHSLSGQILNSLNIPVTSGWNLIGSISSPIGVNNITTNPPNILSSLIYGYEESYIPKDSIYPGKGYWVKVNQNGSLSLNSSFSKPLDNSFTKLNNILREDVCKLIITDARQRAVSLYLVKNNTIDFQKYELPPSPPSGIFDIRFTSNRLIEEMNSNQVIKIQDALYPIKIKSIGLNLKVQDEIDGKSYNEILYDGEEIILTDSKVNLLKISSFQSKYSFRLEQNYPNPFNSNSRIRFEIPNREKVTLRIYDVLGREIMKLIDDELSPGTYDIVVDAKNKDNSSLSSGIYFYQIQTSSFTQTRKMIIQK
ncbi:MAG: S8 family peptidase, partial [Ignavibacteria bacterium]|nr:S8 family peptidase [Ignavibacteria bacterium]